MAEAGRKSRRSRRAGGRAARRALRAEGGFRVSAERVGGVTTSVEVAATRDGVLKLRDPFLGCDGKWNIEYQREGDYLLFNLKDGDGVIGTRH